MKNYLLYKIAFNAGLKLFYILILSGTQVVFGQKKGSVPKVNIPHKISQKEIEKLSKMSESEIEAYRENLLKSLSKQVEKMMDEHPEMTSNNTLPGTPVLLPAKDQFLIDLAENIAVDKTQLLNDVARFRTIIKKEIKREVLIELDNLFVDSDAIKISNNAISLWYSNRREAALYMAAVSVEKDPDNVLLWNNFGALLNQSQIYTLAIPVLKYSLNKFPKSSMILNNLGQSYLGLGDTSKAEGYFRQCLLLKPLHSEANRSMAFISVSKSKNDDALEFFKKEVQTAFRKSSWAVLESQGMAEKINFSEMLDKGDPRNFIISDEESYSFNNTERISARGPNSSNRFEYYLPPQEQESSFISLHLSQFVLPVFPKNADEAIIYCSAFGGYSETVASEFKYWAQKIAPDLKNRELSTHQTMLYGDWAHQAIESLLKNELPTLHYLDAEYLNFFAVVKEKRDKAFQEIEKKRQKDPYWNYCQAIKEVEDEYIGKISGYLENKHQVLQTRWKMYIDKMGYIASLDPTNAGWVHQATSNYFSYLSSISTAISELYPNYYACFPPRPYDPDYVASSNKLYEIVCKKGIGGKLPFGMVSVNLNCERFEMSASVEFLKFGLEKKFATGTSTIWVGAGVEGGVEGIMSIEATQKLYMVFDKNNVFSDAGVSGTMQMGYTHLIKGGFNYSMGVNSGFNAGYKGEHIFVNNVNKAMGYLNLK